MARYPLNLPAKLKQEAEQWAANQGVSLNQFILWSVAEKVGNLKQSLDDPAFPRVTYRRGAAGQPVPVLRGTGIRIQTVVVAAQRWDLTPDQIAAEYGLTEAQVIEGQSFFDLGFCQSVFGRNLIGCQVPALGCHHCCLDADARTAQNGYWLARGAAAVGDTGKGRIVKTLLEGAYLLSHRPQNELIERHTLIGRPLLCLLL